MTIRELEKTAPNEIYLIAGDTDTDCKFNELSEVTWADSPIYEETAIKYIKSPQLSHENFEGLVWNWDLKEHIYREALEILRGMGITSKNRVLMPNGVAINAQEFIEKKLEDAEKLPVNTNQLSVEKLQEIRVEELKNFNSKILQAELKNQKLQKQFDVVKNELKESEKKYQKQMDRFLNSEMNETARSHCESQLKLLLPAHKAYEALAAIGGDDE